MSVEEAARLWTDITKQSALLAAGAPFSNSEFLLISEGVLSEGQHHKLGAVNEHHSTAILWINPDNRDVHVLHKTILKMWQSRNKLLIWYYQTFHTWCVFNIQNILWVLVPQSSGEKASWGHVYRGRTPQQRAGESTENLLWIWFKFQLLKTNETCQTWCCSPAPRSTTLASLKLSSKASLLAPTSCTLSMDITLPKREKAATCSSFSLRVLESVRRKVEHYPLLLKENKNSRDYLHTPEGLSGFDVLWNSPETGTWSFNALIITAYL